MAECFVEGCTQPGESVVVEKVAGERFVCRGHAEALAAGALPRAGGGRLSVGAIAPGLESVTEESLLASARRHAARGLRARHSEENDIAALHFGLMLEHLAKAVLVHVHPTLLVEDRVDFPTLVRLAGQGQRVPPGHMLRTVSGRGALERVGMLHGDGRIRAGREFAAEFDPVLEARNGVAHIGDPGSEPDRIAQLAMCGLKVLLDYLSQSFEGFLGDYAEAGRALLDALATETRRRVQLRIARAREVWASEYESLAPEYFDEALALIDVLSQVDEDAGRLAETCPVCEQTGLLQGSVERSVDVEGELIDGEPYTEIVKAEVELFAHSFHCPFCTLRLTGHLELQEAGLPVRCKIRDATEEDIEAYFEDIRRSWDD